MRGALCPYFEIQNSNESFVFLATEAKEITNSNSLCTSVAHCGYLKFLFNVK